LIRNFSRKFFIASLVFLAGVGFFLRSKPTVHRESGQAARSPEVVFQSPMVEPDRLVPEDAWRAAFSSLSPQPPSLEELQKARADRTGPGKRRYLQLLEAYGFGGASAVEWLKSMLQDPDQQIRRAALRGLGRTETAEAETILTSYAKDGVAIEESTEAALVLGQMTNPAVTGKIENLLSQSRDPVLRDHLVDALAGRPWEETQGFFLGHLRSPHVAAEEKQNALAMLGLRDAGPSQVLIDALRQPQEELRAGAYQGLAWRSEASESQAIRLALGKETDPGLRALAYEAWGNQTDAQRGEIMAGYRGETSAQVRLRALKAWAQAYGRNPVPGDPFVGEAVSFLEQVVMTDRDPGERREALKALQAVPTELSRAALQRISTQNSLQRIRQLARPLSP
jgi:HEAT repeat protein